MSGSPARPDPRRRPSPAVYRRRRLVALLVLLALLAAVIWGVTALVGRFGGGDEAEPAAAAVSPEPGGQPAADTAPSDCRAADVDVDLAVDPPSPTAGEPVSFDLTVVNSGTEPCLLDVGPAALAATVTSGGDTVWTTAHCAEEEGEDRLLLDTGTEHVTTVRWPGTRSADGCAPDQPVAGAGTYRVAVSHDGEERSATFTLQPAPEPEAANEESADAPGEEDVQDGGIDPDEVPAD